MKKIKFGMLALLAMAGVMLSGCNTITEVGQINGVNIATHTKRAIFSPSTCASYSYRTNQPGVITLEQSASSPGLFGQAAAPAGIAGGAALLRPDRTSVVNSSDNKSTSSNVGHDVATGSVTVNNLPPSGKNTPPSPPPGHVDNPSGNH